MAFSAQELRQISELALRDRTTLADREVDNIVSKFLKPAAEDGKFTYVLGTNNWSNIYRSPIDAVISRLAGRGFDAKHHSDQREGTSWIEVSW